MDLLRRILWGLTLVDFLRTIIVNIHEFIKIFQNNYLYICIYMFSSRSRRTNPTIGKIFISKLTLDG